MATDASNTFVTVRFAGTDFVGNEERIRANIGTFLDLPALVALGGDLSGQFGDPSKQEAVVSEIMAGCGSILPLQTSPKCSSLRSLLQLLTDRWLAVNGRELPMEMAAAAAAAAAGAGGAGGAGAGIDAAAAAAEAEAAAAAAAAAEAEAKAAAGKATRDADAALAAKNAVAAKEEELRSVENEITNATTKLVELKGAITKLEGVVSTKERRKTALEVDIVRRKGAVQKAQKAVDLAIAAADKSVGAAAKARLEAGKVSAEEKLGTESAKLATLQAELEAVNTEKADADKQLETAKAEVVKEEAKKKAEEAKKATMEGELAAAKKTAADAAAAAKAAAEAAAAAKLEEERKKAEAAAAAIREKMLKATQAEIERSLAQAKMDIAGMVAKVAADRAGMDTELQRLLKEAQAALAAVEAARKAAEKERAKSAEEERKRLEEATQTAQEREAAVAQAKKEAAEAAKAAEEANERARIAREAAAKADANAKLRAEADAAKAEADAEQAKADAAAAKLKEQEAEAERARAVAASSTAASPSVSPATAAATTAAVDAIAAAAAAAAAAATAAATATAAAAAPATPTATTAPTLPVPAGTTTCIIDASGLTVFNRINFPDLSASYIEKQADSRSCGRRALNNLLGGLVYDASDAVWRSGAAYNLDGITELQYPLDMHQICRTITPSLNGLIPAAELAGYCQRNEWHDINVLRAALDMAGYLTADENLKDIRTLDPSNRANGEAQLLCESEGNALIGFIVNYDKNHWVAVKKLNDNQYMRINSSNEADDAVLTPAELCNFFREKRVTNFIKVYEKRPTPYKFIDPRIRLRKSAEIQAGEAVTADETEQRKARNRALLRALEPDSVTESTKWQNYRQVSDILFYGIHNTQSEQEDNYFTTVLEASDNLARVYFPTDRILETTKPPLAELLAARASVNDEAQTILFVLNNALGKPLGEHPFGVLTTGYSPSPSPFASPFSSPRLSFNNNASIPNVPDTRALLFTVRVPLSLLIPAPAPST